MLFAVKPNHPLIKYLETVHDFPGPIFDFARIEVIERFQDLVFDEDGEPQGVAYWYTIRGFPADKREGAVLMKVMAEDVDIDIDGEILVDESWTQTQMEHCAKERADFDAKHNTPEQIAQRRAEFAAQEALKKEGKLTNLRDRNKKH